MLDQIDRYKLASPPDVYDEFGDGPQEEGEFDWTGDEDVQEHLHPEEGDDY